MEKEQQKKIKNRIKLIVIAVTAVVLSLAIVLIVQTVRIHKLEDQKQTAQNELSSLEQKDAEADKKMEELLDPSHNDKYYEQEHNHGSQNDYLFN